MNTILCGMDSERQSNLCLHCLTTVIQLRSDCAHKGYSPRYEDNMASFHKVFLVKKILSIFLAIFLCENICFCTHWKHLSETLPMHTKMIVFMKKKKENCCFHLKRNALTLLLLF